MTDENILDEGIDIDSNTINDDTNHEETHETEAEIQAKALGWKPEDQFRGSDPSKWLPAEDYLKVHSNNNSALKRTLERERRENNERIARLEQHYMALSKEALAVKEREHQEAIAFLKHQRKSLREEGQFDAADEITDRIQELSSNPPKAEAAQNQPDPLAWRKAEGVPEWLDDNPWVDNDPKMAAWANTYAENLVNTDPSWKGKGLEFLKEVELATKRAFPEKFARRSQSVETSTASGSMGQRPASKGIMTYDKLPPKAKATCDELVADGILTREQYVKNYAEFMK